MLRKVQSEQLIGKQLENLLKEEFFPARNIRPDRMSANLVRGQRV